MISLCLSLSLVRNIESQTERERIWSDVASAAESGWDFSTRWFAHTGEAAFRLDSIRTTKIVPVDLNAFLCLNARFLSRYFELAGNYEKALYYQKLNNKAKLQMATMHWNATDQTWYDHDLETGAHVRQYYISNAVPLYARCYDDDRVPHQFYHYLKVCAYFDYSINYWY